jgi:hypothetical protein
MTKNTMGTKLPRKLEQKMAIVGEQIKMARLRRNLFALAEFFPNGLARHLKNNQRYLFQGGYIAFQNSY